MSQMASIIPFWRKWGKADGQTFKMKRPGNERSDYSELTSTLVLRARSARLNKFRLLPVLANSNKNFLNQSS